MKVLQWNAKDAAIFFQEKDYIDTLIIPLVPISFDNRGKEAANDCEFVELVSNHIEKQFKGRVLQMPQLPYFLEDSQNDKEKFISNWIQRMNEGLFKFIFLITNDADICQISFDSKVTCIWVPSIPLVHLEESYKYSIIENQVNQILNIFVNKWNEMAKKASNKLMIQ